MYREADEFYRHIEYRDTRRMRRRLDSHGEYTHAVWTIRYLRHVPTNGLIQRPIPKNYLEF